ncbi:hypothetical protein Bca4012_065215 [Brassica carinata]
MPLDALRLGRSAQFIVASLLCNLYLNSTPAMKFYFDMNLPAIAEFTATHKKQNSFARLRLLRFSKEWLVFCFMHWLQQKARQMRHFSTLQLYHVELSVDDGNDNATFVVFDREVLKLTKKDAAALAVDEINGGGGEQLPQCLEELGGKEFVFQIRVTPFNFTQNHRIFTVSGISDHIEPETFNTNEASIVVVESGQPSASASTLVEGECMIQIQPVLRGRMVAANVPVSVTKL